MATKRKKSYAHKAVRMETMFTPALEGIKHVKSEGGEILSKPFLDVCKHILPVLDKFGAAMSPVKTDIGGNIIRLESKYSSNPSEFNYLYSMIIAEIAAKLQKDRAMDFLVQLFRNLLDHPDWAMSQACTDSYNKTLKQWPGWLASSSFTIALNLAPDRKNFMEVTAGTGDFVSDMKKFCSTFSPLFEDNHKFLVRFLRLL